MIRILVVLILVCIPSGVLADITVRFGPSPELPIEIVTGLKRSSVWPSVFRFAQSKRSVL